jgi:hypothetical protein
MRHIGTASLTLTVALATATAASAQTTIITEPAPPAAVVTAPPTVVTTDPLALTPVQRRIIYRTIVQQPPVVQRQVTVGAAAPVVEYRVGARVPASTALYPVPQEVVAEVPAVSNYRYTVVNNRAWLVDPASGMIVSEIDE